MKTARRKNRWLVSIADPSGSDTIINERGYATAAEALTVARRLANKNQITYVVDEYSFDGEELIHERIADYILPDSQE